MTADLVTRGESVHVNYFLSTHMCKLIGALFNMSHACLCI